MATLSVNVVDTPSVEVGSPSVEVEDNLSLPRDNRVFTHLSLTTPYIDITPCRYFTCPVAIPLRNQWALGGECGRRVGGVGGHTGSVEDSNRIHLTLVCTTTVTVYKDSPTNSPLPVHLTLYRDSTHLSLSVFKQTCIEHQVNLSETLIRIAALL